MASPSHRANILDPDFAEIGVTVVSGEFSGSNTTVVVQMFGAKAGQKVAPQKSENNLSWDSGYLRKSLQSQRLDNSAFWDEFFEKFKSFFMDTSTNLRKMFVQEVFLA